MDTDRSLKLTRMPAASHLSRHIEDTQGGVSRFEIGVSMSILDSVMRHSIFSLLVPFTARASQYMRHVLQTTILHPARPLGGQTGELFEVSFFFLRTQNLLVELEAVCLPLLQLPLARLRGWEMQTDCSTGFKTRSTKTSFLSLENFRLLRSVLHLQDGF